MSFSKLMDLANYNLENVCNGGKSDLGGVIASFVELTYPSLSEKQCSEVLSNIPTNPEVFGDDKEKYNKTLNSRKYKEALGKLASKAYSKENIIVEGKTR